MSEVDVKDISSSEGRRRRREARTTPVVAGVAGGPWPCGVDLDAYVVRARRRGEGRRTASGDGPADRFGASAGGGVRGLASRGCGATCSADGVGSRGKILNAFLHAFDAEEVGVEEVSTVAFRVGDDEPLNTVRTRQAVYRQDGKTQGLIYVG